MSSLRFIFWDQLSMSLSSLRDLSVSDTILMCELKEEASRIQHHPKKIALWFSAMRHFAEDLRQQGIIVRYVEITDPLNTQSLTEEVKRALLELSIKKIIITEPSEYLYFETIQSWANSLNVVVEIRQDDRFLCNIKEFKKWAGNKKQLRMEYFYREMRKKYSILLEPDGNPIGGFWNYDKENRKPPAAVMPAIKRITHKRSVLVDTVLNMVADNFKQHFGDLEPFNYATTRNQALVELDHFIEHILPYFGDYQDAMLKNNPYVYHSLLSSYLNIGLLLPLEVCKKAEAAYHDGKVSLSSAEGFIRQILGWREFIRGIYWLEMPAYRELNYLNAQNALPYFYWGKKTNMHCIKEVVSHSQKYAYSHHIQRLMITGNFALLAGLDVKKVQEWYLGIYSDAYEWVEMPNTLGMALFGDGGIVGSKPYAASGQYVNRMSDFCKSCYYDVKKITGPKACPFNSLYWDFLYRNRAKLKNNLRLSFAYKTWEKFNNQKKTNILSQASQVFKKMKEEEL